MARLSGTCIEVKDGDTIVVKLKAKLVQAEVTEVIDVRLDVIDALEVTGKEREIGGLKAQSWLRNKIEGKEVEVELHKKDYYKRWLAFVFIDGVNVGEEMLKLHLAERYSQENHNNGKLDI